MEYKMEYEMDDEYIKQDTIDECPKCHSTNIEYVDIHMDSGFDGGLIIYSVECLDCKIEYRQIYNLVYDITVIDSE